MTTESNCTSVLVFTVAEGDFEKLSSEISSLIKRKGSSINGLLESAVLGNDSRTQLWLISAWESRDMWAQSRWDRDIDQLVTDVVEHGATYRIETLVPISVVQWRR